MAEEQKAAITAEAYAAWLTPSEALKLIKPGSTDLAAKEALLIRLEHGLIRAVAKTVKYKDMTEHYFDINPKWWILMKHGWLSSSIWSHAADIVMLNRTTSIGYGYSDDVMNLFGVKFEPDGVRDLITKQPEPVPAPVKLGAASPSKNKGGRPKKDFWDDLWLYVFEQLWENKLKPDSQADIERAMLDWAQSNDHELSETSVKSPARKLFKIYSQS